MSVTVFTTDDFKSFKNDLDLKFENLFSLLEKEKSNTKRWLKSNELKSQYGISTGKQQYLRDSGELPFTKILGTIYYLQEDVEKILQGNKSA